MDNIGKKSKTIRRPTPYDSSTTLLIIVILWEIIIMDDLEKLLSENLFSQICKTNIISRILGHF